MNILIRIILIIAVTSINILLNVLLYKSENQLIGILIGSIMYVLITKPTIDFYYKKLTPNEKTRNNN